MLGEPPTLDPYGDNSSDLTYFLARPVYRSLARVMPDGVVESDLVNFGDASNFTAVKDGLVVSLEPARWSDGSTVTAADVVHSVDRAKAPSGFVGLEARALDRRRVRFSGDVFGDWVRRLAVGTYVVPRTRDLRIGAGPFVVDRYVPGLEISYVPNPEWDGDAPLVDRITVQFIASLEIMLQLLERSRLDAAVVPSAVNIDERLDELGLNFASVLGREVISLDLEQTPSHRLRAAIVAAIGEDVIEEGLIRDEGKLIGVGAHNDVFAPPGTEIQLGTAAGDELLTMMQKLLQRQFEPDISSELVTIAPATFYGAWEAASPLDVALRREVVPGFHRPRVPRDLSSVPIFSVESFLAWNDGVVGLEPNGTLDGPFWNAEMWALE